MRSRTIGANHPAVAYDGSNPIANVENPMMERVTRKAYFRPTKSPMRPKNNAPKGRTRKPTAKVARYAT